MAKHIPTYRFWFSYLWEQVLEVTASSHNAYLHVSLVHGRLQLVAEDAIYSFGDYYLNFRKVFEAFDFERLPDNARVLLLGLGLGSIPELLEDHLGLDYQYVAVEIDPVIIELAADYSLPFLLSPIEVHEADAYQFLQLDARKYDLICVDVFQDATVPEHLDSASFLELLRHSVEPGGAIIYNRLADSRTHRRMAQDYYDGPFRSAFPRATVFDSGGNLMLVNDRAFLREN